MAYCTADDVKKYSQVTFDQLGFSNDDEFTTWLTDVLIPRAEAMIQGYCNQSFTTVPADVTDVCARLCANALQVMILNRSGPLVRVGDYRIEWADRTVFTDDLRRLLARYVKASIEYA
jgi:hypothetical protein